MGGIIKKWLWLMVVAIVAIVGSCKQKEQPKEDRRSIGQETRNLEEEDSPVTMADTPDSLKPIPSQPVPKVMEPVKIPCPEPFPSEEEVSAPKSKDPSRHQKGSGAKSDGKTDQGARSKAKESLDELGDPNPGSSIPDFPWPPPRASATDLLSPSFFEGLRSYCEVDWVLNQALESARYFERSYYQVPEGFALVSRLEQITPDGSPEDEPDRWSIQVARDDKFSLADYFKALFHAEPGLFRLIVFVVTDQPFSQSQESMTKTRALQLLQSGANTLPPEISRQPWPTSGRVTALIYEFEKNANREAVLLLPGKFSGRTHLQKAEIWGGLNLRN